MGMNRALALSIALSLLITPLAAHAGPFKTDEWGEHWKGHAFVVKFNYWRDDANMMHVKNGELTCREGGRATNLWDFDMMPLINPIWEYNGATRAEHMSQYLPEEEFTKKEPIPENTFIIRHIDPALKPEPYYWRYDFTDEESAKVVATAIEQAKKICGGFRAEVPAEFRHENPHLNE